MVIPKIGDKVIIHPKSPLLEHLQGEQATVTYIDEPNIYNHYLNPIQIELNKPYDESGQKVIRLNIKEVKLC